MMKRYGSALAVLLLLVMPAMLPGHAYAQNCSPYSYTLTNGQTADANQVMGNFNQILNCANASLAPVTSPTFVGPVTITAPSSGYALTLSGAQPTQIFYASGGAVDQKRWDTLAVTGSPSYLVFRAVNDAYSAATPWMQVTRGSGYTVSNVMFPSLNVYATNFVSTSDLRLKTNVLPIRYGLSTLMQLKPVSYDWAAKREGGSNHPDIGLIAQDVQPIIPESVSSADDEAHTLGVAYGSLVPVLIKAVQEQQTQIDELRATLAAMKASAAH